MTPRLHVLLGPGGVGKTTLAAGYALALARDGRRVGLLGIDPSRRLQGALGVALADLDTPVPGAGELRAAIVHPHQAVERWMDAAPLAGNPFFVALGDRLATAIDVLAAARIAEWLERDPTVTDLVVDTAPGLAAIEFLRSPEQIAALVEGRLVRWLRAAAQKGAPLGRVLVGFSRLAGADIVLDLAELFARARGPLEQMVARVERTRRWLASDAAELLLVTSPRDGDARGAAQLRMALHELELVPHAVVVNRTWAPDVATELAALSPSPFTEYVRGYLAAQTRALAVAARWAPLIEIRSQPVGTRAELARLGAELVEGLHHPLRSAS